MAAVATAVAIAISAASLVVKFRAKIYPALTFGFFARLLPRAQYRLACASDVVMIASLVATFVSGLWLAGVIVSATIAISYVLIHVAVALNMGNGKNECACFGSVPNEKSEALSFVAALVLLVCIGIIFIGGPMTLEVLPTAGVLTATLLIANLAFLNRIGTL